MGGMTTGDLPMLNIRHSASPQERRLLTDVVGQTGNKFLGCFQGNIQFDCASEEL